MLIPRNKQIEQLLSLRQSLTFNSRSMIPNPLRLRTVYSRLPLASVMWQSSGLRSDGLALRDRRTALVRPLEVQLAPKLPPLESSSGYKLTNFANIPHPQLRRISNSVEFAAPARPAGRLAQFTPSVSPISRQLVIVRDVKNRRVIAGPKSILGTRANSGNFQALPVVGTSLTRPNHAWRPSQMGRGNKAISPTGRPHSLGPSSTPENRLYLGDRADQSYSTEVETQNGALGVRGPVNATIHLDGAMLGRWAVDHLGRVLAKPAAGMTGVDPRAAFPRGRIAPF